jgi:hypothetical protein
MEYVKKSAFHSKTAARRSDQSLLVMAALTWLLFSCVAPVGTGRRYKEDRCWPNGGNQSSHCDVVLDAPKVIRDCWFRGCNADKGGALAITGKGACTIHRSTFVLCTATGDGGGFWLEFTGQASKASGYLKVDLLCAFNCSALGGGGVASVDRGEFSTVTITNCNAKQGGGIHGKPVVLENVNTTRCSASGDGQAFWITGGSLRYSVLSNWTNPNQSALVSQGQTGQKAILSVDNSVWQDASSGPCIAAYLSNVGCSKCVFSNVPGFATSRDGSIVVQECRFSAKDSTSGGYIELSGCVYGVTTVRPFVQNYDQESCPLASLWFPRRTATPAATPTIDPRKTLGTGASVGAVIGGVLGAALAMGIIGASIIYACVTSG